MAGKVGGRSLEETPTWAVAIVCFVLVAISIIIEHIIHLLGKWLSKRNRKALFEALEKIKSELMMLGFLSLLLTVGQNLISKICVSEKLGSSWHPCDRQQEKQKYGKYYGDDDDDMRKNFIYGEHRRRLLLEYNEYMDSGSIQRRALAGGGKDGCSAKGQVPLISPDGIHQLHIFIFVLAVFHVICCLITLALGRLKMRKWKAWEMETKTPEYQYEHDPERFRFARDTSFGRRHMNCWSQFPFLLWVVCFFRQFVRSVPKVDYLTLRHGFIIAHMAPHSQTNFNFQNYIRRTLEQDFKVVVAISPPIWFFAVLFLLFNTNGWKSYLWLPFIPLIIILLVGTKLQVIITKMGLRIQERGEVVKGAPVVQPADDLFWFNRPRLLLYLVQFVFFQNAFQLAFFAWAWLQFGMRSCFHQRTEDVVIRISMGVLVQILCSYVTLPLYALVTQMGSKMKPTIFNERIAKALRSWHQTARKQIKKNRHQGTGTPVSSMPSTPRLISPPPGMLSSEVDNVKTFQRSLSPPRASLHSEVDRVKSFPRGVSPTSSFLPSEVGSVNAFPRNSTYVTEQVQAQEDNDDSQFQHRTYEHTEEENEMQENSSHVDFQSGHLQLEINVADFSFEKNI